MKKEKEASKSSSIILIVVALLVIVVIAGVGIFTNMKGDKNENKKNDGKPEIKYNTNENVVKDQEIGGILFTNIKCSYDGSMSLISYTIVNNTNETINLKEYEVEVKDKDGTLLALLAPNLDQEIPAGEKYDTGNAINIDLSNAYSMELKLDGENNQE